MASQGKINAYMERHRLGPLFQDLMNKVLRDMPEEPMVYLLRAMYKKAGMEIPQGIRYGGVRKSTSDIPRNTSPERLSRSAVPGFVSHSADVGASRDYERPWATSPPRKMKPKKSEEATNVYKSKPEWNSDKMKISSLDQFWEDAEVLKLEKTAGIAVRKSSTKKPANAWATVGMGEEVESYTSPAYAARRLDQGHGKMTEVDILAAETVSPSLRSEPQVYGSAMNATSSRYNRGPQEDAKRQRARMAQILKEVDQRSDDSGVDMPSRCGNEDGDAIELLEDAEDLRREGVINIPKSGYKLSKAVRFRKNEPTVKLNINAFPIQSVAADPIDGFESERTTPDQRDMYEDEEEFESISQVTGPRQPIWNMTDSDGDLKTPGPSYSREPPRHSAHKTKRYTEKSLAATTPAGYFDRSVDSTEDLAATAKTWTADENNRISFDEDNLAVHSLRSEASTGGWRLPDDSDVASVHDWQRRVKGGPSTDPKAY